MSADLRDLTRLVEAAEAFLFRHADQDEYLLAEDRLKETLPAARACLEALRALPDHHHLAQVLSIIRGGMEGDTKRVAAYAGFLADKLAAEGRKVEAERVRKAVTGEGEVIKPLSPFAQEVQEIPGMPKEEFHRKLLSVLAEARAGREAGRVLGKLVEELKALREKSNIHAGPGYDPYHAWVTCEAKDRWAVLIAKAEAVLR